MVLEVSCRPVVAWESGRSNPMAEAFLNGEKKNKNIKDWLFCDNYDEKDVYRGILMME